MRDDAAGSKPAQHGSHSCGALPYFHQQRSKIDFGSLGHAGGLGVDAGKAEDQARHPVRVLGPLRGHTLPQHGIAQGRHTQRLQVAEVAGSCVVPVLCGLVEITFTHAVDCALEAAP